MPPDFLLYGANGFVGSQIARMAVQRGFKPILAGRNSAQIQALAAELGLPSRIFSLDDPAAVDAALKDVAGVLHCAGPFIYTSRPMADGCLRTGAHYLDLTGEIPVFEALANRDDEARARNVMLLPGAGFDVVPTDCLALHLKRRLPSAAHLTLAWSGLRASNFPPGTVKTMLEIVRRTKGFLVRRNGQLVSVPPGKWRMIDFGKHPVKALRWTWGDVFTAYYSTGIPNIEAYAVVPEQVFQFSRVLDALHPLLRFGPVRDLIRSMIPKGSTPEQRARSRTVVWGEVEDEQEHKAVSRLAGPEASVNWTGLAALAVVGRVLAGDAPPGFQTPARAYGADLVMECEGVTREDVN